MNDITAFNNILDNMKQGDSIQALVVKNSKFRNGSIITITYNPDRADFSDYPYDIKGTLINGDVSTKYSRRKNIYDSYKLQDDSDDGFLLSLY